MNLCPCHSGKSYHECCQLYHTGTPPENALKLMRSRYAAYALHLAHYIMQTTHPNHRVYSSDKKKWEKEILIFCESTEFRDLKIVKFIDGEDEAYVIFTAFLTQGGKDATFTERSRFVKINDHWLYEGGEHI